MGLWIGEEMQLCVVTLQRRPAPQNPVPTPLRTYGNPNQGKVAPRQAKIHLCWRRFVFSVGPSCPSFRKGDLWARFCGWRFLVTLARNSGTMSSLYTVKGVIVLDNDGERLLAKYYDDESYPTVKEQRAFEKSLFQKTSRTNGADIVMFEGVTCVFKSNVDLLFYVFGSATENELMLSSVLNGFYDAIRMVVRDNLEKATLFQSLSTVLMILDEIVDGGIILETNPSTLAAVAEKSSSSAGSKGDGGGNSDAEKIGNALTNAASLFRRHLLT
mmetsp:Transcript_19034/g.26741  ORF Transcript_19034/g.26741 Transcript_19034/m.26741 type:complete len:272 (-) Transcript_19034:45-860(-)